MMDVSSYKRDADLFFRNVFQRNVGILTEDEQTRLRTARVAIAGVGGVGGSHLINLVRTGVGHFHIADMDTYDIVNIQRQYGASVETMGKQKTQIMKDIAVGINPHAEVVTFDAGVSADTIGAFLEGVDVLLDGIDFFSFEARRMIFNEARKRGIYTITAGPLGFGSAVLIFSPQGMSFDDYFDIREDMDETQKLIAFAVGLAPASLHMKYLSLASVTLKEKKGPSLVCACTLCSALAVTETLRIILKRGDVRPVPHYAQFDPYRHCYSQGVLWGGNRNLIQQLKRWYLYRRFK